MKIAYPAIFEVDKEDSKFINVSFPDIWGGVTFGEGFDNAMYMAKDLLKLMLTEAPAQCEKPSSLEYTQNNFPDKKIIMVEVEI